jgi:hypothetical protein
VPTTLPTGKCAADQGGIMMFLRSRAAILIAIAACLAVGASACAGDAPTGVGALGVSSAGASSPAASPHTSVPATPAPRTSAPADATPSTSAAIAPLTCSQTKHAEVGSETISYHGYHDSIPLGDGVWSGEDGNTVTWAPKCGIGDLDGDGAKDALGVVSLTSGGSGDFFTLVFWRNVSHAPVFWALRDLGDRNPVRSIAISGHVATVVYCTRTDDAPMAILNVTRTATFTVSGHHLNETGHTDVSGHCTP